jgi:two-component system, OmpR family, sensor histidine kinase TctE
MNIKPEPAHRDSTLTHTLISWLLIPLLIMLAASALYTYHNISRLAEIERDLVLEEVADDLKDAAADTLQATGKIDSVSPSMRLILDDARDHRFFAIYDANGVLLAGDPRLPILQAPYAADHAAFSYISLAGNRLRMVAVKGNQEDQPVDRILVAETLTRRGHLALRLSRVVLIPQVVMTLLIAPLIWFGVKHGLRPLDYLCRRISRRSVQQFKDLPMQGTPRELQPVVMALNKMLSQVRAARDEQRRFTTDAAHQIKTPLAALVAEIALAQSDPSYAHAQPVLRRLGDSANRLAHLVQQLLALAQSEASDANLKTLLDLAELAKDVTREYVPIAHSRHIDLGYEGAEQTIPIRGNAVLIREAMKNLLDNAVKFTPDSGTITVSVKAHPPSFAVADSGPGIPDEQRPLIFQRFHRAPECATAQGSGLGLAIVQEIARNHGAIVIVARSSLGGALFSLQFQDQAVSES